jgi:hypothetical protein
VDTSNTTEQIDRDRRRLLGTAATGIVATGTATAIVLAVLEPFREVSIHDEGAVNRRSMSRIMARRIKATAFRA